MQGGLGQDELFGQGGNDFVDCGPGEDVASIDDFSIFIPVAEADFIAPNCELLYVGVPDFVIGPAGEEEARDESGDNLSAIDTRAEAERAEEDGLLRQIR